jgi:putative hemolysin
MEKIEIKEDEVLEVLDIGEAEGSIDESEKEVIESIISFEDLTVDSVMMPKTKMDCIDVNEPLADILDKVKKWKYSRIPVYENEFDNIIGLLYTKDLLILNEHKDLIILKDMIRQVQFVPEAKKVRDLLIEFKKGHYHLAIVIDEYGVVQGMITMEDILEEIVGDIFDEYDVVDTNITPYKQGMFLVNGDVELEVLDHELNLCLTEDCNDEVRTLSGYIILISGKIPKKGEIIRHKNMLFWIKDVDKRIIKKVVIKKYE